MKRFTTWFVNLSVALLCSQSAWAAESITLPIERRMLFNAWGIPFPSGAYYRPEWKHEGPVPGGPGSRQVLLPGTNHVHTSVNGNVTNLWKLTACRTGTSAWVVTPANFVPPRYTPANGSVTNWQVSLQNTLAAMIETPYYREGVGTFYFDAINAFPVDATEITVEIATNMLEYTYLAGIATNVMYESEGPQGDFVYSNDWQTLDVLTLNAPSTNDFTRYQRVLNYRQAARLRIRRTGALAGGYTSLDNAFTAIDNLCVSYPPSDVVIRKPDAVFQPGHPSVATNIAIRCYVGCAEKVRRQAA